MTLAKQLLAAPALRNWRITWLGRGDVALAFLLSEIFSEILLFRRPRRALGALEAPKRLVEGQSQWDHWARRPSGPPTAPPVHYKKHN